VTSSVERAARNQVLFREVNERIAELTTLDRVRDMHLLICECSDEACAESLEVALAEYEAVRAHSDRFVVARGHELLAIERVVDANPRFVVVEKFGTAGEVASRATHAGQRPTPRAVV